MKKLLSKIFLTVFFVLSSVAGFLIALSSSYGDAPVSGTLTLSETIECGYWDYSEEVPFTIKVGNKVGNESRGYFTFFLLPKNRRMFMYLLKDMIIVKIVT